MRKPVIVFVSGVLAAGKTTLLRRLLQNGLDGACVFEDLAPLDAILRRWAASPSQYAHVLQHAMYVNSCAQLRAAGDADLVVSDFDPGIHHSIYSGAMHDLGWISEAEWQALEEHNRSISDQIDAVRAVYRVGIDRPERAEIMRRLAERGRPVEQEYQERFIDASLSRWDARRAADQEWRLASDFLDAEVDALADQIRAAC